MDGASGSRFQIYAVCVAVLPGLCGRFTRLRVDGKRDRQNIYAVLNLHGYVWTGPDKALGVVLPSVPLSL